MRTSLVYKSLLALAGSALAASAFAVTVSMPPSPATDPSGIILVSDQYRSGGTGFIDPFLRLQDNTSEAGFNTSGALVPPNEAKPGPWTHDLLLANLLPVTFQGGSYFQISLDINQNQSGGPSENILLTDFEIRTGTLANRTNLTGTNLRTSLVNDYQLGDINAGSGVGDVQFYIPVFNYAPDTYLTLFANFERSNDGIEEFSAVVGTQPPDRPSVPEGGTTALLLGSTLICLAFVQRRVLN
jgi:hypothetical protein